MAAGSALPGIFLTVFTLGSLVLVSETAPQWTPASVLANQGEEVTVECRADNVGMFDIVRIFKKGDSTSYPIADGNEVKDVFKKTRRYNIEGNFLEGQEDVKITKLTITDVRGEDAGDIVCKRLSQTETPEAVLKLTVLVPLKEVYIVKKLPDGTTTKTVDGETVTLTEEADGGVACVAVVNGSTTAPNVRMVIDGEDKTKQFVHIPKQHVLNANGGLGKYSAETHMTYFTRDPDAAFNGKTLTCEATMEGFDPVSTSVDLVVKYTPIIICNKYEHWGTLDGEISFKCQVQSFPKANITWEWGSTNRSHLLSPGTLGVVEASEKDLEVQDQSEVLLTISKVSEEHFTEYVLSASNDVDHKEVTITLHRGQTQGNKEENTQGQNPPYYTPNPGESVAGQGGAASSLAFTALSLVHSLGLLVLLHLL